MIFPRLRLRVRTANYVWATAALYLLGPDQVRAFDHSLIFSNATFRGKYFRPQSGATIRRSGLTNGRALRIRPATISGVSIS